MKRLVLVIDMQNDFIDGALGTKEAQAIVPNVVEAIKALKIETDSFKDRTVYFCTYDNHYSNYKNTLEGKKLPIYHCQSQTYGWEYNKEIKELLNEYRVFWFPKETFGNDWYNEDLEYWEFDEIIIFGLCTDICVVSNALILRALFPNMPITCLSDCCAGTTPKNHEAALRTMASCQIDIKTLAEMKGE